MKSYPIRLGTMLYTMVEPRPGHEVEYNRWYERDHFYGGCMVGPYQFAGDRFVATKRLKDLRYPATSVMTGEHLGDAGKLGASYLALYWILDEHHDDWNRWAVDTVKDLHATGRMFGERDHIHTGLYNRSWTMQRSENGTPIELALDRPYQGLVVNVGELAQGAKQDDIEKWTRETWGPTAMAQSWGPDLIGSSTILPLLDDAPPDVPRTPNADRRFMQLHFLDHDAADGWAQGYGQWGAQLEASGLAKHLWTGPFQQTIFGTDTYTDELR